MQSLSSVFLGIEEYVGKNVFNIYDKFCIMYPDYIILKISNQDRIREHLIPNPRRICLYYADSKNISEIVVG